MKNNFDCKKCEHSGYAIVYCDPAGNRPAGCCTELITGKDIEFILTNYNFFNLEWKNDAEKTRLQVPRTLRRNGLWITYTHNGKRITERYIGNDLQALSTDTWKNSDYWEEMDFEEILNAAMLAVERLFNNIGDYPNLMQLLADMIADYIRNHGGGGSGEDTETALKRILNNLSRYPDIKTSLTNFVKAVLMDVLEDLENNEDVLRALTKLVQDAVKDILTNIDNYPPIKNAFKISVFKSLEDFFDNMDSSSTLKTKFISAVEKALENIITNITSYSALKDLSKDFVEALMEEILGTLNSYPTLKSILQNIHKTFTESIFTHLNDSEYSSIKSALDTAIAAYVTSQKGANNGIVPLDNTGKIDAQYIDISRILTAGNHISIESGIISCTCDNSMFIIVDSLPVTDINPNKIYIAPDPVTGDYGQYVYSNGSWVSIGAISGDVQADEAYTSPECVTIANTIKTDLGL